MQKIITLIILFAFQCTFAQSLDEYNSTAISAFKAGKYQEAKEYFEHSLALSNNANTNYNLANTYEKLGEIGKAKAYYMRAIYQNPRLKEAVFNLNALDKKYALKAFNSNKADIFFDELSHNEWILISAISLWLVVFVLIILPLLKVKNPWQIFLGIIFLSIFILSAFGVHYWRSYANTVVSLKDNAPLKFSPTETSQNAFTAKEAELFSLKSLKKDFALIENASKKAWAKLDKENFIAIDI